MIFTMGASRAEIDVELAVLPKEIVDVSREIYPPREVIIAVVGLACLPIGLLWDISHHSTIGRDTFWTPAHILIQLGGIIPASIFGWLALKTTFFGSSSDRAGSVRFCGARAPFGAWITMWGCLMMLTSAPFDDWWHNTYGLDVKIESPPHAVLGFGMLGVALGVIVFVFSWQNRTIGRQQRSVALFCALAAGVILTLSADFLTEKTFPNQHRSGEFYKATSAIFPFVLVMAARASVLRWPATIAAAFYMLILMLVIWILPLFPAQPKLAPIYHKVDHMVPPAFPMLLILPALLIDLIMQWTTKGCGGWANQTSGIRRFVAKAGIVLAGASVFLIIFLAVQWHFSAFLMSDWADNWFFAREGKWPYWVEPGEWMTTYWTERETPVNAFNLLHSWINAVIASAIGFAFGGFLLKVRR